MVESKSMAMENSYNNKIIIIAIVCGAYSAILINRWIFLDATGPYYGRIWHYYTTWQDLGFTRRSLLGTLLRTTGLQSLFDNEYVFSYLFHSALALLALVLSIIVALRLRRNLFLTSLLFLSPSMILHQAYNMGNADIALFYYIS